MFVPQAFNCVSVITKSRFRCIYKSGIVKKENGRTEVECLVVTELLLHKVSFDTLPSVWYCASELFSVVPRWYLEMTAWGKSRGRALVSGTDLCCPAVSPLTAHFRAVERPPPLLCSGRLAWSALAAAAKRRRLRGFHDRNVCHGPGGWDGSGRGPAWPGSRESSLPGSRLASSLLRPHRTERHHLVCLSWRRWFHSGGLHPQDLITSQCPASNTIPLGLRFQHRNLKGTQTFSPQDGPFSFNSYAVEWETQSDYLPYFRWVLSVVLGAEQGPRVYPALI